LRILVGSKHDSNFRTQSGAELPYPTYSDGVYSFSEGLELISSEIILPVRSNGYISHSVKKLSINETYHQDFNTRTLDF
jgi:hypothetical protein